MMLGDAVTSALEGLRAHAESMMLDQGRAIRRSGDPVYDEASQSTTVPEVELFASRCKIQASSLRTVDREVGARTAIISPIVLHLPHGTPPLLAGDEWELVEVDPLSAVVAGRRYRVAGPFEKSLATARRYEAEEVVA